ncbi:hypothetical protein HRW07_24515 [Streptomyces lunaelactis]|uniref:hypothetical protein n=1 Tax=Streptomyces lunaelactis TaxID=1535768 RepID=UPI0015847F85|nr:hypothetical protein [Streptomyces lunaelactis]NUL06335.1 hypothetical protein [Streptomyces lunaelactis]
MSQQYPGPQQPYQPYQGPTPYQPPPPKKGWSATAIVFTVIGGVFAFLIIIGIAVGGGVDDKGKTASDRTTAAPKVKAGAQEKDPDEALKDVQDESKKNRDDLQKQIDEEAEKDGRFGDGDYVVGEDVPPGTYTSKGAKAGLFEFCSVTTEPTSDSKFPQLKSANKDERIIITLTKADGVVTIQGCEPLTLRK